MEGLTLSHSYDLVIVEWDDSTISPGWSPHDDAGGFGEKKCPITTTGWLLADTPTHLLVSQSVSGYSYGNMLRIPKGCVLTKQTVLTKEIQDEEAEA